jgi:two-component system capsular synthesis response regulator RcsB
MLKLFAGKQEKPAVQMKMIRILHANDHQIYLDGIRNVFEQTAPHIKITGEAGNHREVLSTLVHIPADILLIDDKMPGGEILETLPLIHRQYPRLKIIFMTMFDPSSSHIREMMNWAHGGLNFTTSPGDLIKAVETVYRGGYYFFIEGYENKI